MVLPVSRSQFDFSQLGLLSERDGKGRQTFKYSKSGTFAYIPSVLLKIEEHGKNLQLPVENLVQYPIVTLAHMKSLQEDIENHVEQRIQLFFQQILLFYGLGVTLENSSTDMQVGRGNKDYAAAHSSTFPSLISKKNDQSVLFGKGSSFYLMHNATVLLPLAVNKIDSQLDLQNRALGASEALRKIGLRILNRSADELNPLDPKKGLIEFLTEFQKLVVKAQGIRQAQSLVNRTIHAKDRTAQDFFVLECYQKVIKSYAEKLGNHDELIKQLAFARKVPEVNREFYLAVQGEMLRIVATEVAQQAFVQKAIVKRGGRLKPVSNLLLSAPSSLTTQEVQKLVGELLPNAPVLEGKARKYQGTAAVSVEVQKSIREYFGQVSKVDLCADLSGLARLKSVSKVNDFGLSNGMRNAATRALKAIQESGGPANPNKFGAILLSVIRGYVIKENGSG